MFENAPEIVSILTLATVAGFLSSVLGGVIALSVKRPSKRFIGLSFMFASSVLLSLVFVDFLPHAIGHGHYHIGQDASGQFYQYWYQHSGAGIWLTVLGVVIGVGFVTLLSFFDKYGHEHVHGVLPHNDHCSHTGLSSSERKRMFAAALPIVMGIVLHDIPKGLAIGASGSILAAVAIGLSCIPEGMTIAIPLKASGTKAWKVLSVCGVAGAATVLGALIGYLVGGINVYVAGVMFAIAAGCVLAVVFTEILPMAIEYSGRSRWKLVITTAGVLLVVTLNYFFHGLMH